jgi:hypothetical protein
MAFDPATLLGGYTQPELDAAFSLVANTENWKYPIDATLPSITSIEKRKLIVFAVMFFTGSTATLSKTSGGKIRVTAPGYYAALGA